jgi:hypothetical protein
VDRKVLKVLGDLLDPRAPRVILDPWDFPDPRETRAIRVREEHRDSRDRREIRVSRVLVDSKDPRETRETLDPRDLRVLFLRVFLQQLTI